MLINACILLNYIPDALKTAEVIMIPKPGKNLSEVESYQSISLLPVMSKLFEKLILEHLKPIIAEKHLVPTHQFGFRRNPSTIDQVHRITDIIEKLLKTKACALLSFLTFHKISTEYGIEDRGLLHKQRSTLPDHFCLLLKSYLPIDIFVSGMKIRTQN
jgi:hypothetical protein